MDLKLPLAMAELRPALGEIVGLGLARAPYFSIQLASRHGLSIFVDYREERVPERPPAAGTVLSAFDRVTSLESAICGLKREDVKRSADYFVSRLSVRKCTPPVEPVRRGILPTS